MASNPLSVAAIVCGMAAIGACFLDWAEPRRPAGEIADELRRGLEGPERLEDPSPLLRNLRQAYADAGTDAPFHGVAVIVFAGLGVLLTAAGAGLATTPGRRGVEVTLRLAGAAFGVAFLLVLMDCGSSLFEVKDRGAGLWIALAATLAAALTATFASVPSRPSAG